MVEYKVEIELLSDATFGDGSSKAFVVNSDVLTDKDGFPYMRAKTFKGNLQKSMSEIGIGDKELLESLFGSAGINDFDEKKKSKLQFSDLVIASDIKTKKDYIDSQLSHIFIDNSQEPNEEEKKKVVIDCFTDIKHSVKLEDGIAKDKSLRSERVILKGSKFETSIYTKSKLSDVEKEILSDGLKSLKNIGLKKYRGRGLLRARLISCEDLEHTSNSRDLLLSKLSSSSDEKSNINIKIKNIQPVKIANSNNSYDYETSKRYISASSIRGAIISNVMASDSIDKDKKDEFIERFIKVSEFSNAYPIIDDNYTLPSPMCFVASKDVKKEFSIKEEDFVSKVNFNNLLKSLLDTNEESNLHNLKTPYMKKRFDAFNVIDSDYIYLARDKEISLASVRMSDSLHHTTPMFSEIKENIYRYNSIDANQNFHSKISFDLGGCDEEFVSLFKELINEIFDSGKLYIGGSKSSGFGLCEILVDECEDKFLDLESDDTLIKSGDKEHLCLYAYSDISKSGLEEVKEIFDLYGFKLEDDAIKSISSNEIISGFNNKWGCNLPTEKYLKRGSLLLIDIGHSSAIDHDKLKQVTNIINSNSFGKRTKEGFGKFIVTSYFTQVKLITKKKILKSKVIEDLSQDMINCDFSKKYLKKMILRDNFNRDKDDYLNTEQLSKSQISQLLNMVRVSIKENKYGNIIKTFNEKFNDRYMGDDSLNVDKERSQRAIKSIKIKNKKISELDAQEYDKYYADAFVAKACLEKSEDLYNVISLMSKDIFMEYFEKKLYMAMLAKANKGEGVTND